MSFLETIFLGNTVTAWGVALAAVVLLLSGFVFGRSVLESRLRKRGGKDPAGLHDLALRLVRRTKSFFLGIVALYLAARTLTLPAQVMDALWAALVIASAIQAGIWGNVAIAHAVGRAVERRVAEDAAAATTMNAAGFVGRLALWTLVLLMVLGNLGYEITPLLAGLGVGGIAVALAVQNILGDLFASLSIVLDKPFEIGDFVIVGDMLGTIEYIGLKTTRIRSLSGEQIVFCNSDLLNSRIRNFKRMYERRVVFEFGVAYETPYEPLKTIPTTVREIVEAQPEARFDRAHFFAYGESSLTFEVVYHVLVPDFNTYMDIQQAINLELFRRFAEDGIQFAYPTRTLYLHDAGRARADGGHGSPAGARQRSEVVAGDGD